ncbi:MAG TPA: sodium:solute symporter family protein [Terriglobales bacterium]|nr:sodium:solute symporter family protein [Terriglobales bacterium]
MQLSLADWLVVVAYFTINLGIGALYYRRASGSVSEYFISGRNVPWWLAGTSMVATTFGADTPLVVTGIVYRYGIAGNWLWWTMALSGMMTVFFFARLWRRAGVLTDMEFAELRYAGRPAAFLRGFRALYLALPVNTIIMGWVNLAMAKILELTLGVKRLSAVMFCLGMTVLYTAISGLWAVLWTDLLQFVLKMGMVIVLAVFAVRAVGGIHGLTAKLAAHDVTTGSQSLAFVPDWTSGWFLMFLVYLSVNWWASWYPGAEPGGGGYIAQRIFSAKNEKHSLAATLWFNLAHYALRPWPWILTALVAVVLYPSLRDPEVGYIQVMIRHLPASLRGLMLAGFAAAYMSTIGTHINLGASYMINDFYRRFVKRDAGERHYVKASRLATIVVTLLAAVATYFMSSIEVAWKFLISIGAGAGLVFMLRWFWWRINAWSEISAMSAAGISSLLLQSRAATGLVEHLRSIDSRLPAGPLNASDPHGFAWLMILTTACTTVTWLVVTFLTPPEPAAKLREFYQRVRPAAAGWRAVIGFEQQPSKQSLLWSAADWIAGCALIYGSLFGIGYIIFGHPRTGIALLATAAACAAFIFWDLGRRGWDVLSGEEQRSAVSTQQSAGD